MITIIITMVPTEWKSILNHSLIIIVSKPKSNHGEVYTPLALLYI